MSKTYELVCKILNDSIDESQLYRINKQGAAIQERFFQIKKECPNLLADLIFDESGITPYSEELDQIFYQLEIGEILSTGNPDMKEYQIKKQSYLKAKGDKIKKNDSIKKAVNLFKEIMV